MKLKHGTRLLGATWQQWADNQADLQDPQTWALGTRPHRLTPTDTPCVWGWPESSRWTTAAEQRADVYFHTPRASAHSTRPSLCLLATAQGPNGALISVPQDSARAWTMAGAKSGSVEAMDMEL